MLLYYRVEVDETKERREEKVAGHKAGGWVSRLGIVAAYQLRWPVGEWVVLVALQSCRSRQVGVTVAMLSRESRCLPPVTRHVRSAFWANQSYGTAYLAALRNLCILRQSHTRQKQKPNSPSTYGMLLFCIIAIYMAKSNNQRQDELLP